MKHFPAAARTSMAVLALSLLLPAANAHADDDERGAKTDKNRPFDREAARRAFNDVDFSACNESGATARGTRAVVAFEADGYAVHVSPSRDLENTRAGTCVRGLLANLHVPAFRGARVNVSYSFTVAYTPKP